MCHRSIRLSVRVRAITAVAAALAAAAGPAPASVVVTETASPQQVFWLLNLTGQQGIAHTQIVDEHDVIAVQFFTDESLAGADVVYFTGLSAHSDAEIDALVDFVDGGGRLILAADLNPLGLVATAARFGVTYGEPLVGEPVATVSDFENGVTNGPAGVVESYSALVPNGGLASTNSDFEVLASYPDGQVALGYLRTGAGEVVFLTDLNTFDNDRLGLFDNQTLWTNLFAYTAVTTLALDLDVKPGSCPNPVNVGSRGFLPIALPGAGGLDVLEIDLNALSLSRSDGIGAGVAPIKGSPGPHSVYEDVTAPAAGLPCACPDREPDGIDDISLKFAVPALVDTLALDGEEPGAVVELVLIGALLDGTPFEARDCITLVSRGSVVGTRR